MKKQREGGEGLSLPDFMNQAQSIVDRVQPGFEGKLGEVFVFDAVNHQHPNTFRDDEGTVYVRARSAGGQLVPVDIDEARQLAHEGKIVLNNAMVTHRLLIAFDQNQLSAAGDKNLSQPFLLVDWIDLGGRRVVTGARCFYGNHRHSYIPIDNLVGAASATPDTSKVIETGLFGGERKLPLTAAGYMDASVELLDGMLDAVTVGKEHPSEPAEEVGKVVRLVREGAKGIDGRGLQEVLHTYRDRLRNTAKRDSLGDKLVQTRGKAEAKNARQDLIQNAIARARRNMEHAPSYLAPYTFDEVISCVDQDALIEAFEHIPDPYFRVVKTPNGYVLRVAGSKSTPDTLGMTYQAALEHASQAGLVLSAKDDANYDNRAEKDAWIDGGLASGAIARGPYSHPEIGAHLSKEIPLDTAKLGLAGRARVVGRKIWRVITFLQAG